MKKHLLTTAALIAALTFTNANAQFELAANTKKTEAAPVAGNGFETTKAYQKFHKNFPESKNESWIKSKEGFAVRFTANGILNTVFLTKAGNTDGRIRYYGEDSLPRDVRQIVKSKYYDYAIALVQEVTYDNATAYLVTIEDKTTWKIVRVADGEMDVREEYLKAN